MNTTVEDRTIMSFSATAPAIDVDALYRRYGPMVLRRCRALLRDEDRAMDAMQDVFVQVLRHQDRLDARYPSSLLYRIATNTCLNILRGAKRRRDISNDDLLGGLPGSGSTEDEAVDRVFIEQLFVGEKGSTRRIAEMRGVENLSWEETAQRVGLSVTGARKRMSGLHKRGLALLSA
jgi:RNA polymerase sigma-70 factor (ECF subfamily)